MRKSFRRLSSRWWMRRAGCRRLSVFSMAGALRHRVADRSTASPRPVEVPSSVHAPRPQLPGHTPGRRRADAAVEDDRPPSTPTVLPRGPARPLVVVSA